MRSDLNPRQSKLLLHGPKEYAVGFVAFEAKFFEGPTYPDDCTGRVSEADMGSFGDVIENL